MLKGLSKLLFKFFNCIHKNVDLRLSLVITAVTLILLYTFIALIQ